MAPTVWSGSKSQRERSLSIPLKYSDSVAHGLCLSAIYQVFIPDVQISAGEYLFEKYCEEDYCNR